MPLSPPLAVRLVLEVDLGDPVSVLTGGVSARQPLV